MKPRILFLEVLPTISGGQKVLIDLLSGALPFEAHVLLPGRGPLADGLAAVGATCHFAPMSQYTLVYKTGADWVRYVFELPRLALHAARLAHRINANIVYANSGRAFLWGTLGALLKGLPVVWHVHNLLADRKALFLLQHFGRWRTVRRIIAASSTAAEQFPALKDKVAVVPSGVDTTFFHPDPTARVCVRTELDIPLDVPVVGIVGDLIPLKGQHTLLEAARLGLPEVRYLLVGGARPGDEESHAYASRLREMAGDHAIFAGRREDLPAVLNALDLLVVASERETGPLVLLEALACGVPVISTPVGRAPALVKPCVTGDLFPVGDPAALANRLTSLLSDRTQLIEMGEAARELAEAGLDLAIFRERVRDEIESLFVGAERYAREQ
jgi:glycosyltransferase involved in cell wall biosynthesis